MAKANQADQAKLDQRNRPRPEPALTLEQGQELTPPAALPDGQLAATGDGALASQADRLGDPRLHAVQRQAIAAQIGQVQGNQHLQRVVQRQAAENAGAASLIVEDDAPNLQPGQMRKSEFLAQLQEAVCAAADEALAGSPYSALGCPYIASVFSRLPGRPAAYIERGIRLYAPEAAGATTAAGYFLPIANRVRAGIAHWRETGEVTGVPTSLASLAEGAPAEAAGGGAVQRQGDRAQPGGPALTWIQMQPGEGQPLDSGIRQRMESGLGQSLGGVTLHTDTRAARMAEAQDARAFTVGQDVFFGAGEYRPGTPVGDAILAHELAHVIQQRGATAEGGPVQKAEAESASLEHDADSSAAGVLWSLWGNAKGVMANAVPTLRSGLRFQRCPKSSREREREETEEPGPDERPGPGPGEVTVEITEAERGVWGRDATRLEVEGTTNLDRGTAELYYYGAASEEDCTLEGTLPPEAQVPIRGGRFQFRQSAFSTTTAGIGRLILVRVTDGHSSAYTCARVQADEAD